MMKTSKTNFCAVKSSLLNALMLTALAAPGLALAEDAETTKHKEGEHVIPESAYTVTANVGFTTDYIFRGIAQTAHNPAVQGGIDFAHASGLYAGIWGSNVSWIADSGAVATGSVTMELDTYFGFRNSFADDFTFDVGFVRYNYLGDYTPTAGFAKADTDEIYGALGYKWVTAKYSYALGQFLTVPGAQGTDYIELNASVPVGDSGFTFGAHIGKQTFKPAAASIYTYTDYKLSVSKDIGGYVVGLAYSDTNAGPAWTYAAGGDWGKGIAALSVTHAF